MNKIPDKQIIIYENIQFDNILMYRGSNQRYNDNNPRFSQNSNRFSQNNSARYGQANPGRYDSNPNFKSGYPYPEYSMPKMQGPYPGSNPLPLYDYPNPSSSNPNYQYLGHPTQPPPQSFDRPYPPSWRDVSQPKGPMMPMGPPPMQSQFQGRPVYGAHADVPPPKEMSSFMGNPPGGNNPHPQVNVVQRISGLIKSQLGSLQGILAYAQKKTTEERLKKDRSRSRSRSRGRDRGGDRGRNHHHHREWNCPKCNFLNFDFRDQCKKCHQSKPSDRERDDRRGGGGGAFKNYVPGPDDWRCFKCNNINYARRTECHRCHAPRSK